MNKYIALYIILFLSLMISATAVTINSVSVSDNDVFYSNYAGNSVVNLIVNVTGANTSSAVGVIANIVGFEVNGVSPCPTINLINSGGDLWRGSCDLGTSAGALASNTFKSGTVSVTANETYGPSSVNTNLTIAIYNIDPANLVVPSACYRFGNGSTNFNQETNFNNNFNIHLIIQASPDSSCVTQGYNWGFSVGWLTVGELTFTGVNFNNNLADASKLTTLSDIVKLKFASSGTYQNNRLTIDTTRLPELNVNSLVVKLFHLSLISPTNDFIISDNGVLPPSSLIHWTSGFDSAIQNNTYTLDFTVGQGFKGFTITDTALPTIVSYSPSINQVFNTTNITFNTLVSGTGTPISKVLFVINGVSNNANCVALTPEQSNCSLTLTQTDGSYNLSIAAYDFGGDAGNVKIYNLSYSVQTSPPTITPIMPLNGVTYAGTAGSMLNLKFTATDGNGVSSCKYSLAGPVTITTTTFSCLDNASVQLYLSSGAYNLTLSSTDTTGMTSTSNISFTVTDTTAPVITDNSSVPTSTDAILSVNTDESATCKYDVIDTSYTDMRYALDGGLSLHNDTVTLTKDQTSDYYIRCSDLSNNVDTTSLHVALLYGVATAPKNDTIPQGDPTATFDLGSLPIGTKVIAINKLGIPLLNLVLITNKIANVSLKITAVSAPLVTYSEKVYKYVTIEHSTLSDDSISDVKIKFSVDKKWLADNNINESDIILFRYATTWVPLNTTLERDDSGESVVYYLADSPGLSLFAISVKSQEIVNTVLTAANITNTTGNVTSTDTNLLSKRNFNWTWVIILSILVFIILVLFILVQQNDAKSPPIFPEDRTPWGRVRRLFK